jgi:hypothetical protein
VCKVTKHDFVRSCPQLSGLFTVATRCIEPIHQVMTN